MVIYFYIRAFNLIRISRAIFITSKSGNPLQYKCDLKVRVVLILARVLFSPIFNRESTRNCWSKETQFKSEFVIL